MDVNLGILLGTFLALQFVTLCRVTHVVRGWRMTIGGFALYLVANGAFLWVCAAAGIPPLAQLQLGCSVLWVPLVALMVFLSRGEAWRTFFVALDYVAYVTAVLPICHVLAFCKTSIIGGGGVDLLAYPPCRGACGFPFRAAAARSAFK